MSCCTPPSNTTPAVLPQRWSTTSDGPEGVLHPPLSFSIQRRLSNVKSTRLYMSSMTTVAFEEPGKRLNAPTYTPTFQPPSRTPRPASHITKQETARGQQLRTRKHVSDLHSNISPKQKKAVLPSAPSIRQKEKKGRVGNKMHKKLFPFMRRKSRGCIVVTKGGSIPDRPRPAPFLPRARRSTEDAQNLWGRLFFVSLGGS